MLPSFEQKPVDAGNEAVLSLKTLSINTSRRTVVHRLIPWHIRPLVLLFEEESVVLFGPSGIDLKLEPSQIALFVMDVKMILNIRGIGLAYIL